MEFYNLNLDVVYNYSTFTSIYFNPLSASNNSIGIIGRCSNATNNDSINLAKQLQNNLNVDSKNKFCFNKNISIDSVDLGGSVGITQQFREIEFYMLFNLCSNKDLQPYCTNQAYLQQYLYNYLVCTRNICYKRSHVVFCAHRWVYYEYISF